MRNSQRRCIRPTFLGLSIAAILFITEGCSSTVDQPTPAGEQTASIAPDTSAVASSVVPMSTPLLSSSTAVSETAVSSDSSGSASSSVSSSESSAALSVEDAAAEEYATKFAADDETVLDLLQPGSAAFLYTEGSLLLASGGQYGVTAKKTARNVGGGWSIADGVTLRDFKVSPEGLITTFLRNNVPVDDIVAAGDGTQFVAVPTTEYDEWTGSVEVTVHSFRLIEGNLAVVFQTKNDSSGKSSVSLDDYVIDGSQTSDILGSDETLPGVTRATASAFEAAAGGGRAYGQVFIDNSQALEIVVDVPKIGP